MKKLLLSLLACGTLAAANAQEGSILLYGNAGLHSASTGVPGDQSIINWNVNPGIGYQFDKNWTVGLNFGFSQAGVYYGGTTGGDKQHDNRYNLGPFVRYTQSFWNSKTFFWYGQFNASYVGGYSTYMALPSFGKNHGFDFNIVPAVGANLGHSFCLNFSVGSFGYSTQKYTDVSNAPMSSNFDLSFGQQVNLGISKNFGGMMHHHRMHGHHEPMDETRSMDTSDDDGSSRRKKHEDE